MFKKFGTAINKKDNENKTEYFVGSIGAIISQNSTFSYFIGAKDAPTSVI